jgi:hypothetical protein
MSTATQCGRARTHDPCEGPVCAGTVRRPAASVVGMGIGERLTVAESRAGAGCFLAGLGAAAAALVWAPQAEPSIDGGFEGHARDLSVLYIDLPLVVLGGALLPLLAYGLTGRWVRRPWVAPLVAVAALALGVWGLAEWWTPRRR